MAMVIIWAGERDKPVVQSQLDEWAKMIIVKYPRPGFEWQYWAMNMLQELKWWEANVAGGAARRLWNGTAPVNSREEAM